MQHHSESQPPSGSPDGPALVILHQGVRLMALRRLGDAHLANDAAQETVVRVLAALAADPVAIANLGAFAHGVARHVIADIQREQSRATGAGNLHELADPSPAADALASAIADEDHRAVRDALARLPEADRALLHLCFVEGLTPAEVAARTGEPAERVRKRKSRALERLREVFTGGHAPRVAPTIPQAAPAPGVSSV